MNDTGLLKAIYENVIEGIFIIDAQGGILSANPAACNLFGYDVQELTGKYVGELMSEYDLLYIEMGKKTNFRSDFNLPADRCKEIKAISKSGDSFPARLSLSEVLYNGQKMYAGLIHDLSCEKKAEEKFQQYTSGLEAVVEERTEFLKNIAQTLEQAKDEVNISLNKEKEVNQMKNRFVSLASHEFRSPLSSIKLSASLIERYYDRLDRSKVFSHLHKIKIAVDDLTDILEGFLSLEKIDSGKTELHYTDFDLPSLCKELITEVQAQAKTGQTVSYTHNGSLTDVFLDKKLLRCCLVNLLSNAIKYSGPAGAIHLTTDLNESAYRISVADDGIGIPYEDQPHIFEAFFRAHNTINIQGTGLGLNIVKRYADMMHGQLSFECTKDNGTIFRLSFPTGPC
jgi:two-component system sensor kinase FixL